jgi:hypothetical protein
MAASRKWTRAVFGAWGMTLKNSGADFSPDPRLKMYSGLSSLLKSS